MKLTIKYFGQIAETMGMEVEMLEFQQSSMILSDLKEYLTSNNQQLSKFTYKLAVNQKLEESDFCVKNNDEISILPPFSGG